MSNPLPVYDPNAPAVCSLLRTKSPFGTYGSPNEWMNGNATTAVYWCLATMSSAGPDDHLAHPHEYGQGRGCYQKPID